MTRDVGKAAWPDLRPWLTPSYFGLVGALVLLALGMTLLRTGNVLFLAIALFVIGFSAGWNYWTRLLCGRLRENLGAVVLHSPFLFLVFVPLNAIFGLGIWLRYVWLGVALLEGAVLIALLFFYFLRFLVSWWTRFKNLDVPISALGSPSALGQTLLRLTPFATFIFLVCQIGVIFPILELVRGVDRLVLGFWDRGHLYTDFVSWVLNQSDVEKPSELFIYVASVVVYSSLIVLFRFLELHIFPARALARTFIGVLLIILVSVISMVSIIGDIIVGLGFYGFWPLSTLFALVSFFSYLVATSLIQVAARDLLKGAIVES